ncbi:MAG: DUF479 domain-containing protein [Bacteroidetes bacterium]|nr:MAG: DUF479 domain-containing protein [Bacteroidota bacterium]
MNYLAHAYLSFGDPAILAGNMFSDFVKGRRKFDFSSGIQNGISLHRSIDNFTDTHPVTKEAKVYFKNDYGLYSAAFVDVVYDHFLANDRNEFPADSLADFAAETYQSLNDYIGVMPEKFQYMFSYMKKQNWLYNYQYAPMIKNSFEGLVRRARYLDESDTAFAIFEKHYEELKECYAKFFPQLKKYSLEQYEAL